MKQYLQLLKDIKEKGTHKPAARKGMPSTKSLFGYQFRHDLQEGFPLLTTKQMYWKGVVVELLWFLKGNTNIKYLLDNGVNIWNEDAYQYYLKKCKELNINDPIPFEGEAGFISLTKHGFKPGTKKLKDSGYRYGDCGFQYGRVWRDWDNGERFITNHRTPGKIDRSMTDNQIIDYIVNTCDIEPGGNVDQIAKVIRSLKEKPQSRRHMITAVDPANDDNLALYWCHSLFQFNCRPLTDDQRRQYVIDHFFGEENAYVISGSGNVNWEQVETEFGAIPKYYLDCQMYQRSADVFLGVPFNIASYALLTHIMAKICNMIPGEFIYTFGDVHIYDNHWDAVTEQLSRTPTKLPKLKLSEKVNWDYPIKNKVHNIDELLKYLDFNDFEIENYNPQPKIKAKLSTGLK